MSEVRINLPIFEGPLDLLLYLIRRDELDIWDIPIARITDEYLQYIDTLAELDLDVAGDFVVMAATLTEIKSRMLLPSLLQDGDGEDPEDPRQRLVERLLDYERYRQAAHALTQRDVLGRDVFSRAAAAVDDGDIDLPLPKVELWDLVAALREALDRARLRGHVHHVDVERFSVVDRIHWLHDRLQVDGDLSFRALFDAMPDRMSIILTFLALLEMLKRGIASLTPTPTHDLLIALRPLEGDAVDEPPPALPAPADEGEAEADVLG